MGINLNYWCVTDSSFLGFQLSHAGTNNPTLLVYEMKLQRIEYKMTMRRH